MSGEVPLTCWTLTEGHAGMENQCRGLAEALGIEPELDGVHPRRPWVLLPPALWWRPLRPAVCGAELTPPWPDLLISCGRRSVAAALGIRAASAGRTVAVHVQAPHVDPARFDLVVVPRHDRLRAGNVVVTRGALHRITPARLAAGQARFAASVAHLPRPLVGVLVGGSNRRQEVSVEVIRDLVDRLLVACRSHGAGLMVTSSRRTGERNEAVLREGLREAPATVWDGTGENPYFGLLALADVIVVTGDSVSMVSEACATGKPVYVYDLEGGSRRLQAFHAGLREDGVTRPFTGALEEWHYEALDETPVVARAIADLLAERGRVGGSVRRA